MQATLDSAALKHLTRALTCLSKYGDDLTIYATDEHLSLSATNSSMSAYCRFRYSRQFFSRYNVESNAPLEADETEEIIRVSGQLLVKPLLSILKHRTVEKSVDRCELSIVDGVPPTHDIDEGEDHDSLESKLIVRLHCKHGVVKTHRLLLLDAPSLLAPSVPESFNESRLSVGPRAIKDMLEHFSLAKGPKSDPQLVWSFGDEEVLLKGLESSLDTSVRGQLSTELTISAAEFEVYDIYTSPIMIAFHLREFLATIAFAETQSLALDMRFTDPASPLFIDVEGDLSETLFVISTSQVAGPSHANGGQSRAQSLQPKGKKRELEQDQDGEGGQPQPIPALNSVRKKPMKAVVRTDRASVAREMSRVSETPSRTSMPPPSFVPLRSVRPPATPPPPMSNPRPSPPQQQESSPQRVREPLFLPGSQLSQAAEEAIRESGLGIEDMDADEFMTMLEGEGEEVTFDEDNDGARDGGLGIGEERESDNFRIFDEEETQLQPTPGPNLKAFRPLFDD